MVLYPPIVSRSCQKCKRLFLQFFHFSAAQPIRRRKHQRKPAKIPAIIQHHVPKPRGTARRNKLERLVQHCHQQAVQPHKGQGAGSHLVVQRPQKAQAEKLDKMRHLPHKYKQPIKQGAAGGGGLNQRQGQLIALLSRGHARAQGEIPNHPGGDTDGHQQQPAPKGSAFPHVHGATSFFLHPLYPCPLPLVNHPFSYRRRSIPNARVSSRLT